MPRTKIIFNSVATIALNNTQKIISTDLANDRISVF